TLRDLKINMFESAYKAVINKIFQDISVRLGIVTFPLTSKTKMQVIIATPIWKNMENETGSLSSSFRRIL
ncbi:hypothetical protein COY29_00800, partial [Candidatus Woesebacteria bacterium CG_4_10_14_0_2_um_filter_39_14]